MNKLIEKSGLVLMLISLLFLTGCGDVGVTDKEIYAVGRLLHNINEDTPSEISLTTEKYGVYKFIHNFPGSSPLSYKGRYFFTSPLDTIASAEVKPVAVPIKQDIYFYGNDPSIFNLNNNFSINRYININYMGADSTDENPFTYNHEEGIFGSRQEVIYPTPGEKIKFNFGSDYIPGSFNLHNRGPFIVTRLKDKKILGSKNTYFERKIEESELICSQDTGICEIFYYYFEQPIIYIYKDNSLIETINLTNNGDWDGSRFYSYLTQNSDYRLEMHIPAYMPIYNKTSVIAEFKALKDMKSPPWISDIKIPSSYALGESIQLLISGSSELDSPSITASYRTNIDSIWKDINYESESKVCNQESICTTTIIGFLTASDDSIDIKVTLTDSSGSNQTYIIEPISLVESDLIVELDDLPEYITPGTKSSITGIIKDINTNMPVGNLLLSILYGGEEIYRSYSLERENYNFNPNNTKWGTFKLDFSVPINYDETKSLELLLGNTGTYSSKLIDLSSKVRVFSNDSAVTELVLPDAFEIGENEISVSVANLGKNQAQIVLDIYYRDIGSINLIESRNITLDSKQTTEEKFSIYINGNFSFRPYDALVIAEAVLEGDENSNNDKILGFAPIIIDRDASVRVRTKNYYVPANESSNASLLIENTGKETLSYINYSVGLNKEDDIEDKPYDNIISGVIDELTPGKSTEVQFEFTTKEEGDYYLKGNIYTEGDLIQGNNEYITSIISKPNGADLSVILFTFDRLKVNETFELILYTINKGVKPAENAYYKLEYHYGYCPETCDFELIKESNLSLIEGRYAYENINFTSSQEGWVTFRITTSASNEINYKDNIKLFHKRIYPHGPDIQSSFSYLNFPRYVITNHKQNVSISLKNIGDETAENILVNIFETNDFETKWFEQNLSSIGSASLGRHNSTKPIDLPNQINPTKKGLIKLIANATLDKDIYLENNYDIINLFSISKGIDVSLSDDDNLDFTRTYNAVGEQIRFTAFVKNLGTLAVNDVLVELYLDNELVDYAYSSIDSLTGDLANRNSTNNTLVYGNTAYIFLNFIVDTPGEHNLKIKANVINDTDNSDNEIMLTKTFYEKQNITFNFIDSQNNPVKRLLYSDRFKVISENSSISFESIPAADILEIGEFFNEYGDEDNVRLIIYHNAQFSIEENISTDSFDSLQQNNITYFLVYANEVGFNYDRVSIVTFIENMSIINNTGLNSINETKIALKFCEDFDFDITQCASDWQNSPPYTYTKFNEEDFEVYTYPMENKVEAFGFTTIDRHDGNTTDFRSVYSDLITNPVIEREVNGRINFKGNVNNERFRYDTNIIEENIIIERRRISVNTDELHEFNDIPATLIFRNIGLDNPIILKDGEDCESICTNIIYGSEEDTLSVDVTGFSTFELVESPPPEPENPPPEDQSDNSGDDNQDSPNNNICEPEWICEWGPCLLYSQNFTCYDENNCRTSRNKPNEESRSCIIPQRCEDNDGDGFGIGPDCFGIDADDSDPHITTKIPDKKEPAEDYLVLIIISSIVLIILIIIFIIMLTRKNNYITYNNVSIVPSLNDKVKRFVQEQRLLGKTDSKIKNAFRKKGWPEHEIKNYFE